MAVVRAALAGIATAVTIISGGCDRAASPAKPVSEDWVIDPVPQPGVAKIDLLFMIDNSISMADKQAILADAVPKLAQRLATPICVDADGVPAGDNADPDCATGKPEFTPIQDIHIGVISSSLGAHGGEVCGDAAGDDKAHLIPSLRTGIPDFQGLGFLWWDPSNKGGGTSDLGQLNADFAANVKGVGELGCGYEASLEAWYRFLVDPQPPVSVAQVNGFTQVATCDPATEGEDCEGGAGICVGGICADKTVLEQRRDFLRGDSLVAIIMLSDENDCSLRDDGNGVEDQSWLAASHAHLPRATAICQSNPDDPCCFSCAQGDQPGCPPVSQDPECMKTGGTYGNDAEDPLNLRCWDQKRRFGVNWLYPTQRYVDGLSKQRIIDRTGQEAPNPLFANASGVSRDPDLIYLAGIVGVPWQLISDAVSKMPGTELHYLTSAELAANGVWSKITHNGAGYEAAQDPHMIESVLPRAGLPDPSAGLDADPFNGHEWNIPSGADLQYACIFPLETPRDCSTVAGSGCDCNTANDPGYTDNNPLCQTAGGAYSVVQNYAKAYPGLRQLEVLRDFGENSIVASICPKNATGDPNDPYYGYSPAVGAIVDRLKGVLSIQCINRPISVTTNPDTGDAETPCRVVEVLPTQGGACSCDPNANRGSVGDKLVQPVLKQLGALGQCGPSSASGIPCDTTNYCLCEINEASDKVSCLNDPDGVVQGTGWCYIDAEQNIGNPALVEQCSPKRQLRFVGDDTPRSGATVFIACPGKPVGGSTSTSTSDAGP